MNDDSDEYVPLSYENVAAFKQLLLDISDAVIIAGNALKDAASALDTAVINSKEFWEKYEGDQ